MSLVIHISIILIISAIISAIVILVYVVLLVKSVNSQKTAPEADYDPYSFDQDEDDRHRSRSD